ncbi:MAG: VapC toxin family domain ribonuclease [Chloroflexi bacterium]|nr:VapC toxin family domain ribonuclease [Chloroflexota bacterium]
MIIDTSALVAMIRGEPEANQFERLLRGSRDARISAASYVELAVVIDAVRNPIASAALDEALMAYQIRVEPFTPSQARLARSAYERFGRGSGHPARLNMGDCFAYSRS